jgi:type I restriction enzyme, S subunit
MGLTPGYKQTDVGVIPEEWEVCSLGTLATTVASGRSKVGATFGNYPVHGSTGVIGRADNPAYEGDVILVARVGANAGKLNLVSGKYGVTDNTIIVRLRYDCSLPFFYRQLEMKRLNSLVFGSGQPLITGSQLKRLQLSVPPLPEQRAIAAALSDVDALIGALDRLIAKKRDLKQAAMQQLLTGQKRLPGFSGEWEVKRLGDVGVFSKGRGIKKDEVMAYGLPCVRYGEIYTHHNDYVKVFNSFISANTARQSERIYKGDLLFAGSGETAEEIGKCVAFLGDEEAYAGGDIVILRPFGQDTMFLGFLMNHSSVAKQKARMGQGDAVVHISARNLSRLELNLPTQPEQSAIAEVLSDMDAEIAALEQRRDKTRALKQGMMQELLTGRTRLV